MRKLGDAGAGRGKLLVFGMPKEAIACGAVEKVVPLSQLAREIMLWQQQAGHAAVPAESGFSGGVAVSTGAHV